MIQSGTETGVEGRSLGNDPSPNETLNLFVRLCPDNGVSCCLSCTCMFVGCTLTFFQRVCGVDPVMRCVSLGPGWSTGGGARSFQRERSDRSGRIPPSLPPPAPPCPSPATHFYADTHSSTYCSTLRHTRETNATNTSVHPSYCTMPQVPPH